MRSLVGEGNRKKTAYTCPNMTKFADVIEDKARIVRDLESISRPFKIRMAGW